VGKIACVYNSIHFEKNPKKRRSLQRTLQILSVAHEIVPIPTEGPDTAPRQTQEAAAAGCDTVIACGGDGTLNQVLQGVMASPKRPRLAILGFGTANQFSWNIGMPKTPEEAALVLGMREAKRISVGKLEFVHVHRSEVRYFLIGAGAGADASLMQQTPASQKNTFGELAYLWQAGRMCLKDDFPLFTVHYKDAVTGQKGVVTASQVLAMRVPRIRPGLTIAPSASWQSDHLQLLLVESRSCWPYLKYAAKTLLSLRGDVLGVKTVCASEAVCYKLSNPTGEPVYTQADGDVCGSLPLKISVEKNAVDFILPH